MSGGHETGTEMTQVGPCAQSRPHGTAEMIKSLVTGRPHPQGALCRLSGGHVHDVWPSVMKKRTGRNPVESSREQLHDERRCALLGVMWVARRCEGFRCGPRGGAWSASRMPGEEVGARCPSGPTHRGERQIRGYRLASREDDLPEPGRNPGYVAGKRG